MAENYDLLSEDKRRHGSMSYADYPPVKMDNAITKVFNARFPRWREGANLPQPPRDTSEDAELLAEIKTRFEWLRKNAK